MRKCTCKNHHKQNTMILDNIEKSRHGCLFVLKIATDLSKMSPRSSIGLATKLRIEEVRGLIEEAAELYTIVKGMFQEWDQATVPDGIDGDWYDRMEAVLARLKGRRP